MVKFPAMKPRIFEPWSQARLDRENKASIKHNVPWSQRGPKTPEAVGGIWKNQRYRPTPERWGNKGGKRHQKKKRNKELRAQGVDPAVVNRPGAAGSKSGSSSSSSSFVKLEEGAMSSGNVVKLEEGAVSSSSGVKVEEGAVSSRSKRVVVKQWREGSKRVSSSSGVKVEEGSDAVDSSLYRFGSDY